MKLLLGSNSPRRKELLTQLGFSFEAVSIDCEEKFPDHLAAAQVAPFLSELKARAFRSPEEFEVLLTADTVVVMENQILGKPRDQAEATAMLKSLSNKTHAVYTAVSFRTAHEIHTITDSAKVTFSALTDEEIQHYTKLHHPYDKAGGYGIQDWLGMAKISAIEGSFYAIMGLPTHLVYEKLRQLGC